MMTTVAQIKKMTDFDYTDITNDRKKFDKTVYFSIEEAIHELHKRKKDTILQEKIKKFFNEVGIPKALQDDDCLVLFRQIATPNYETSRFLIIADGLEMTPLFFEYTEDIFVPYNAIKKSLGKLPFHCGYGKKNGAIIDFETIIDFNESNGKKINTVMTKDHESLIEFHHEILFKKYSHLKNNHIFEASSWFFTAGKTAENYYKYYLSLFIANGILLENFMIENEEEKKFVEKVLIPSLKKVVEYFGVRPLIVALEPTEIEGEIFWYCYDKETKNLLKKDA